MQALELVDIVLHVAGDGVQVVVERRPILALGVPVVDLQRDQDADDDEQDFADRIANVLPGLSVHEGGAL